MRILGLREIQITCSMYVFVVNETIFPGTSLQSTQVFSEPRLFSEQTERPRVDVRAECLFRASFQFKFSLRY